MSDVMPQTRRGFIQCAAGGAAASLLGRPSSVPGAARPAAGQPTGSRDDRRPVKLALASYTLRKFSLDQALAMTRRLGLTAICLKSFHLPLEASRQQIKAVANKVAQAGIKLYGGGVIRLANPDQVERAFRYAQTAGMSKIIAAPSPAMLPLIDQKVQQYDIAVCIHNHGPGDRTFPTPEVAYEKIKGLDRRVGLCHDVGHTARYGKDPVALTERCADRMLDIHMKDVTATNRQGHATPCGRGVIDIPALMSTLVKIGYKGYVSFEYEAEPTDPLAGLAESVGYVRGVLDTL